MKINPPVKKHFLRFLIFFLCLTILVFGTAFIFLPLPGNIPVLMYHHIGTTEDGVYSKNYVGQKDFAMQMAFLHRFGYRVISMKDFDDINSGLRKPRGREIVLTFDDGSPTFAPEAMPILEKYHFPVMLFLISEKMKQNAPDSISIDTVKKLMARPWISIGSHTKTHAILSETSDEQIQDELAGAKADLEKFFGVPIDYVAYPGGKIDARVMETAKNAGYRLAFTTSYKKLGTLEEGLYAMSRQKISGGSDNLFVFWVKISGVYQLFKKQRHEQLKKAGAFDHKPS